VKNRLLLWALLLVGGFLLGAVPFSLRASRLDRELREATDKNRKADLRDMIALAYVQAAQKNYGLAAQTASQYFSRLPETSGAMEDVERRRALEQAASARDAVTAALAKGDPGVTGQLLDLYLKTRAATLP
jgi:hypothetical protein